MDVVASLGGHAVGQVFEGRARFPISVRIPEPGERRRRYWSSFRWHGAGGKPVPLGDSWPTSSSKKRRRRSSTKSARRRTFVAANVRGRDVVGFVAEAQEAIRKQRSRCRPTTKFAGAAIFRTCSPPACAWRMITPVVLLVIFLLLYTTFGSGRLALLIFLAVPMAASGGVFALALRGMPFSISAGVGFIALFGVAVLQRPGVGERGRTSAAAGAGSAGRRPRRRLWFACVPC